MSFTTEQEKFWAGSFGDEYIERNQGASWIAANTALFSQVMRRCRAVESVLEFGANIGLNLHAIHSLLPRAQLSAIEINQKAVAELQAAGFISVFAQSVLEFEPSQQFDFVFTKGVLIHIEPNSLPAVYEKLYSASRRYVCIVEYYNPAPVEVPYRGHVGKLFKRDFAGDLLDRYPRLKLVDYGFAYHRDPLFPQDDMTWFVLEKAG